MEDCSFGKRLKELRKQKGITQEQLASELKLGVSTVGMYELNAREPNFETLEAIADIFNVDMDWLLCRSDIKNKYQMLKTESKNLYEIDTSMLTPEEIETFNKVTGVNKQLFFEDIDEEHDMALFKQAVIDILIKQRGKK
ncbi:helix-turn-helix domain-containing protein [Sebaldella sp. S0638]|uniref:helix-turn-helix domain-containing protein n=1 Tax=Sebaldella sp. S0638 TaxID=2957809 RepID=UPI0020A02B25|nr:helix-turn-helix transcriptional regulator [Sebaldella sp. S0638]MCP1226100.1 helix-turn-helix domain-containing protein [Sebaldella sp. S0638]